NHTRRALEALAANPEARHSTLHVFSDGAKGPEDGAAVAAVRRLVAERPWGGTIQLVERDKNLGLARAVITGVSTVTQQYSRAIVLEDDLIVSSGFLRYMNEALDRYQDNERVMQIAGYLYPIETPAHADALFLPFTTSWGWATWQRAWRYFDERMSGY